MMMMTMMMMHYDKQYFCVRTLFPQNKTKILEETKVKTLRCQVLTLTNILMLTSKF